MSPFCWGPWVQCDILQRMGNTCFGSVRSGVIDAIYEDRIIYIIVRKALAFFLLFRNWNYSGTTKIVVTLRRHRKERTLRRRHAAVVEFKYLRSTTSLPFIVYVIHIWNKNCVYSPTPHDTKQKSPPNSHRNAAKKELFSFQLSGFTSKLSSSHTKHNYTNILAHTHTHSFVWVKTRSMFICIYT